MDKIEITFPDGQKKQYEKGILPSQILNEIGGRLAKESLAVKINDHLLDLDRPIVENGTIEFIKFNSPEGKDIYWHSSAHIMAHAIKELYPKAKFAFGPPVENGFYYDVDLDTHLSTEDLEQIEHKMTEIVKRNEEFERIELEKSKAIEIFKEKNEDYKVEQIERLGEAPVAYKEGDFLDLCRGPHIPSTGYLKYFKLLSVAGAYWLADENNPMLQRIYGISFPKKSLLEDYINRLEEAKKRDHRKLGKELELFSIDEEIGAGLVLWHPKGAFIRHQIESFWREEHLRDGYGFVNTPHIAKLDLWSTSGHLDFFGENMFSSMNVDEQHYQIKPMNCPFHLQIYKNSTKSYRELPIRWAELGTVYRYERSGVLHGLMRVRGFTQDDAHIFCRPDQLDSEIENLIRFCLNILTAFGFESYDIFVSTRPEKYVGTLENWDKATLSLKKGLEKLGIDYEIDPGEGVFYGPKIDIKIRDTIGRSWQCSTIQVDFNEPDRFNLEYIGQDGHRHQPIMIHRALLGSLERFFGVLIEHYAGAFPLWLAPEQVYVLPITDHHREYAETVCHQLTEEGIRAHVDERNEKIGYKIREATVKKIPYMLILGNNEIEQGNVSVRTYSGGDMGSLSINDVINDIKKRVKNKN